ncbi:MULTISPECIES: response regulator transcription factor [Gammaproteobacteria]|uniref:response regulator n=1 Tax=Gammaproteobacteria TaxID=1236 RepID=UPI000DCFDCA6|nr:MULTISPECIES: response regulator transcription factor [Gammaproteobacteria]RTE85585.1 response regulator transcription factor [Aliidiomarina sp. B3213]TCZ89555.1 response regulator transcription factor [Lysobacter sp. N42]
MSQKSYRVLLVDDQKLVRQGLKSLLSLSPEIDVIHDVPDGTEALEWLREHSSSVDVILLDIRMPKLNGIETLQAMHSEGIHIPTLILTTFDDHELLLDALKAGAKGYLLKDVELETLVNGIERVFHGESMIQPSITTQLLSGLSNLKSEFDAFEQPEPLSVKEVEILRLMAAGCSNKEIAEALFKSEGTVKNQVSTIMSKLGVRDRTRAVLKAIELGLLSS